MIPTKLHVRIIPPAAKHEQIVAVFSRTEQSQEWMCKWAAGKIGYARGGAARTSISMWSAWLLLAASSASNAPSSWAWKPHGCVPQERCLVSKGVLADNPTVCCVTAMGVLKHQWLNKWPWDGKPQGKQGRITTRCENLEDDNVVTSYSFGLYKGGRGVWTRIVLHTWPKRQTYVYVKCAFLEHPAEKRRSVRLNRTGKTPPTPSRVTQHQTHHERTLTSALLVQIRCAKCTRAQCARIKPNIGDSGRAMRCFSFIHSRMHACIHSRGCKPDSFFTINSQNAKTHGNMSRTCMRSPLTLK